MLLRNDDGVLSSKAAHLTIVFLSLKSMYRSVSEGITISKDTHVYVVLLVDTSVE